jgi:hypothetical protein
MFAKKVKAVELLTQVERKKERTFCHRHIDFSIKAQVTATSLSPGVKKTRRVKST